MDLTTESGPPLSSMRALGEGRERRVEEGNIGLFSDGILEMAWGLGRTGWEGRILESGVKGLVLKEEMALREMSSDETRSGTRLLL